MVQLKEVEVKDGEEDERVVFKMRAKLFRFEKATTEWKERGTGPARLMQHKESKKVRLLMRRDKTLKICANHMVDKELELKPMQNDRTWCWNAPNDFAEEEARAEMLAIRFANADNANKFKAMWEKVGALNEDIREGKDVELLEEIQEEEPAPASEAAAGGAGAGGEEKKDEAADKAVDAAASALSGLAVKGGDDKKEEEKKGDAKDE